MTHCWWWCERSKYERELKLHAEHVAELTAFKNATEETERQLAEAKLAVERLEEALRSKEEVWERQKQVLEKQLQEDDERKAEVWLHPLYLAVWSTG